MRAGTVLKVGTVAAAAFVVALVAVVKSIDVNQYRGLLASAAEDAMGRRLEIRGPLALDLGLRPRIVAERVVLANAPGGARPEMATIGRVEAEIGLLPLLMREVRIYRLALLEPDLLLEMDANGRGNWQFSGGGGEATVQAEYGSETPDTSFSVGRITIKKGRLAFHDAGRGTVTTLTLDELNIDTDSPAAPIAFAANGTLNQRRIDVSGVVGSFAELSRQTQPFPVKLKASTGGLVAAVDGTVADLDDAEGLDLKLVVEGTEAAEAAAIAGHELPALGPFRVAARFIGSAASFELMDVDAGIGKRETVRLSAKGAVKAPLAGQGIELAIAAEADGLAGLAKLAGLEIPQTGPLKLSGQLTDTADGFRLGGLTASIGKSEMSGEAALALGERPRIVADLRSPAFDLADIGVKPAAKAASGGQPQNGAAAGTAPAPAQPAAPAPGERRVIPDMPLPVAALRAFDLDLGLRADRLVAGEAVVEQAEARLLLKDGTLTLNPFSARLADGTLVGDLVIDAAAGDEATVGLSLDARRVELGRLLASFGVSQSLSGGRTDLQVKLGSRGKTVRGLMSRLEGDTALVVDRAVIDNAYARFLALDLLRELTPWAPTEQTTQVNCLVSRFRVDKGVARSQALLFDTNLLTMGGNAKLDFGSEAIEATLVPRPKEASLVNLATPMDVTGTFANPGVVPNKTALALGVAGAAAGAAIMPLGVLVPLISTGEGDENPCLEALAEMKQGAASGRPPPKAKKSSVLPDVGGFITDLFGKK